jgi:hypothetical protein
MKIVIEESPAESTARRLAKIDQIKYPEYAAKVLKGSVADDEVYYTNSSHLRPDAPVDGLDRAILQSMTNPMIEAGAITHLFTGEKENKADAVYEFVESVFNNTLSSQVVFSGKHTVCMRCGHHYRGLFNKCPACGNDDPARLSQKARIVGYFSDPRKWNKSKKGEDKSRQEAQDYYAGEKASLRDLQSELLESIIEPGKIRIAVAGKPDCEICTKTEAMVRRYVEKKVPEELRGRVEIVKYDVNNEDDRVNAAIYHAPIDSYPTVIVHTGNRFARTMAEYPYNGKPIVPTTGDIDRMFKQITGYQEVPKETAAVT